MYKGRTDSIKEALLTMSREQRGKALLFLALKLAEVEWKWRGPGTGSEWQYVIRLSLTPRGKRKKGR